MPRLKQSTDHKIGADLYALLPYRYRHHDHTFITPEGETEQMGFVERFCRVFGDTLDEIRDTYGRLLDLHNPYKCNAEFLPDLASNYGWPLNESNDEQFNRMLIRNVNQIYNLIGRRDGMMKAIYWHTGITVKEWRVNQERSLILDKHSYLTTDYNDSTRSFDVASVSGFEARQMITVRSGSTWATGVISNISGDTITLRDGLNYCFKVNALVVRGDHRKPFGITGKSGFQGFKLGEARLGIRRIHLKERKKLAESDLATVYTTVIEIPNELLSEETIAIIQFLCEYMSLGRTNIVYKYKDFGLNNFVMGHSRLGFNDRLTGGD